MKRKCFHYLDILGGGKNKCYKIKSFISEHRIKIRKESFANLQNLVKVLIQKTQHNQSFALFCLLNARSVCNKVESIKD